MKMRLVWLMAAVLAGGLVAEPNPPTAENPNIGITPVVRSMARAGGTGAINTSGSGTWQASVSAGWITLVGGTSGTAGNPVAYTVAANDGVERRIGYVYVSGYVHTITQEGIGASLGAASFACERAGGSGSVAVLAPAGKSWHARSNVDWITVGSSTGTGAQAVSFRVAAYDEVSTRSGTLTIADCTFTVNQTGRRMMLTTTSAVLDYLADTVKIRVNALASTEWTVSVDAEWATIVDAGNGRGGDQVVLRIAENPSYSARSAVATIGTERFSLRQLGRTSLVFRIDPTERSFGAEDAGSDRIAVTATPDLGWSATSDAAWISVYGDYDSGSGSGSVMYRVAPNPTLYPRAGVITVTAVDAAVAVKRVAVSQAAAVATLSMDGYVFEAQGESATVGLSTGAVVGWNVVNTNGWLTISGATRTGPAEITLTAAANTSVKPRRGVVRIADHDFAVSQKGRGVEVDYQARVFDTDGKTMGRDAENVIRVTTASDVSWTADASDPWIVVYEGRSGRGNGTVKYIVAPYVGNGEIRTGTITVGDQTVYITQRPYDLSIEPRGDWVEGNGGAGEIQVALDIGSLWTAIATEPWLTIVQQYDSGTGNGKVLFSYTDNNTGKTRTGKIMIAGEVYTITQTARRNIAVTATVDGHGGSVAGGGVYNVGTAITLEAVPEDGYVFTGWTLPGGGTSRAHTIELTVSAAQTYTAHFEPMSLQVRAAETSLRGVRLVWTNLAWAAKYRVWRGTSSSRSQSTQVAECTNDGSCDYLDGTGVENQTYWYWVEAVGVDDDVWSNGVQAKRERKTYAIAYTNLRGATHANSATYREGTSVALAAPRTRRGYTFAGWSPSQIAADATGDQTVRAVWRQNEYTLHFDPNGGTGAMADERFTYGFWKYLSRTNFVNRTPFLGWSLQKGGEAVYADAESVKNLTELANGEVTLYAAWKIDDIVVDQEDGTTVVIPKAWFETGKIGERTVFNAAAFAAKFGTDWQTAATKATGKRDAAGRAMYVWQDFVVGTDPADTNDVLRALVTISNGRVHVAWTPNLNADTVTRIYTVWGRMDLQKGDWETPAKPCHRFFKVTVGMPTGAVGEETAVSGESFAPEELGSMQL
ncbi:MAG: BACON domain-containing carbohydrate-binding protein [bacterium]|nr:BACON domain-containing carbohydrate-binding protein [bacterium]